MNNIAPSLNDVNLMSRPDKRRLKKHMQKLEQYRNSRFTLPRLVMIEPTRNPRAVQYDNELQLLVERPYTAQELMDRAIERKAKRSPKLDMHGNLLQHARVAKTSIHNRQAHKLWFKLLAEHQHALTQQLGISPKYKGGNDPKGFNQLVKEYLKKYPKPTLEDAKALMSDMSGNHH